MQLPTGGSTPSAVLAAIAAVRAHYIAVGRTLARTNAVLDASELCAEFVERLEDVLAPSSAEPSPTPPAGGGREADSLIVAAPKAAPPGPRPLGAGRPPRASTDAQRVAYRRRLVREAALERITGVSAPEPAALPIAGVSDGGYDPVADARAVAASLHARGGKQ